MEHGTWINSTLANGAAVSVTDPTPTNLFNLTIQGQLLTVDIEGRKGQTTYLLREGSGLTIGHLEEELNLEPDKPVSRDFKFQESFDRSLQTGR